MTPGKYDLNIYRGATFESGAISRSVDGVTLNFSVYDEMILRVRKPYKHTTIVDNDAPLLQITKSSGHIVVAGDSLSISIIIPDIETTVLAFQQGRYFLELETHGIDTLTCGTPGDTLIAPWQAITDGAFNISLGGNDTDITGLDFSAQVDLPAVASVISNALGSGNTCSYNGSAFVFTNSDGAIGYLTATSSNGTPIHGTDFLNGEYGTGVITSTGIKHKLLYGKFTVIGEDDI